MTSRADCGITNTAACMRSTRCRSRARAACYRAAGRHMVGRSRSRRAKARSRHHALHVRHHRPVEGRDADAATIWSSRPSTVAFDSLGANDEVLAYLPLAWVGDHSFHYAQAHRGGLLRHLPGERRNRRQDRREIGPTYFFAPPRIFENMLTRMMIRMEDAGCSSARCSIISSRVARRYGEEILNGEPVPLHARLLYGLGDLLVYGPLKNVLGLSRVRVAYTAGEAIGPESVRVLPLARHQSQAALRPDRSIPLHHCAAGRPDLCRHRGPADHRRRYPDRREWRGAVQVARHVRRLFQGSGRGRRRRMTAGRLGADRRRRLLRRQDRASEDHRSRQGCRPAQ